MFAVIAFVALDILLVSAVTAQGSVLPQGQLGATFTYEGQLKKNGAPITDNCSMAFRLYDQVSSGNQVGSPITTTVPITNGLFSAQLDFGTSAFAGEARWLNIKVRCSGDGADIDLGRQLMTAAPYALYASSTGALQGRTVASTVPSSGQVLKFDGITWLPADDAIGPAGSGDISAVVAGNGLSGGGTTGAVTPSAAFAGSGSGNTVARSDHDHWGASWSGGGSALTRSSESICERTSGYIVGVAVNTFSIIG